MKLETTHRLLFDIILGEIAIIISNVLATAYLWMITHGTFSLTPFTIFPYLSVTMMGVTFSCIMWFVIGTILGDAYYEYNILGMPV